MNYYYNPYQQVYNPYQQVYNPYQYFPYLYFGPQKQKQKHLYNYPLYLRNLDLHDYGPNPFVINIEKATIQNQNFRKTLWTGKYFQITLMSLNIGEDIGLEIHPNTDQFIRIEAGKGLVQMGDRSNNLDFQREVSADDIIVIPAGKYHNLINTGNEPIKLYSIYAPPEHPYNTVHRTKAEAEAAHH